MLADSPEYRSELSAIAAETYKLGLQSQRSGNLSVKIEPGDHFLVTRTGSKMGHLWIDSDFLPAKIYGSVPSQASTESAVHQRIYQLTRHEAVLTPSAVRKRHCGLPSAASRGLQRARIRP